jgi:hypothetical protein
VVATFVRHISDLDKDLVYAQVAEKVITCYSKGRIVFTSPEILITALLAGAKDVRVTPESTDHGSINTKKHDLAIGYITFRGGNWGNDCVDLSWTSIEGLNSGWTDQPTVVEPFNADTPTWEGQPVVTVHRALEPRR